MTNPEQAQSEGETIRQQASEWLIRRRDSGSWSADDEVALNGWLNQSPAHGIAYWRLELSGTRLIALEPCGDRCLKARANVHGRQLSKRSPRQRCLPLWRRPGVPISLCREVAFTKHRLADARF